MKQEDRRLLKPSFAIAAALVAVLLLSTLIVTERGSCGENVVWKLRANGKLTVQGDGPIPDYDVKEDPSPFYNRSVVTADLQEGITAIGESTPVSLMEFPSAARSSVEAEYASASACGLQSASLMLIIL